MKICIIQNRPGIGDMCIFLPAIHNISNYYKSKIILITKKRSKAKEFLYQDPHIKEIIYIEDIKKNSDSKLYKYLAKFQFDKIFIMHFGFKLYVHSFLAKIKDIKFYGIFKRKVSITGFLKYKLKKWLSLKDLDFECKIYFNKKKINKNKIIVGIGGSGENKKWLIQNYIDLINIIYKKNNKLSFIIAGGENELNDYKKIRENIPSQIELIPLNHLSIKDSLIHLTGAKLYVGNDTGFMHLCGMLGVTSFGLFGDTPTDYINYNKNLRAIIPESYNYISHDSSAMSKIKYEYVFSQIEPSLH